jgi:hypothetical protein
VRRASACLPKENDVLMTISNTTPVDTTTIDVFSLPVHPMANLFSMMDDDDMGELASSIQVYGLLNPIVIQNGQLIDGRNRREACRRIGIVPATVELDASKNPASEMRRSMTRGQTAMVLALIYPTPETGGRGKNSVILSDVSAGYLSHARSVVKWAPECVEGVRLGAMALHEAYKIALARKAGLDEAKAKLAALRKRYPDLAHRVTEETLSLADAEGMAVSRREREQAERRSMTDALTTIKRLPELFDESGRALLVKLCIERPESLPRDDLLTLFGAVIETLQATMTALEGKNPVIPHDVARTAGCATTSH